MSDVFSSSAQEADTHRDAETAVVAGPTPGPWCADLRAGTWSYEVRSDVALIGVVGNLGATSDHAATAKRWKGETAANARLIAAAPDLLEALRLHDAYLALPQDRGGPTGTKGRAHQAWLDAKAAAFAKATTPAETDAVGTERSEVHKNPEPKETGE